MMDIVRGGPECNPFREAPVVMNPADIAIAGPTTFATIPRLKQKRSILLRYIGNDKRHNELTGQQHALTK